MTFKKKKTFLQGPTKKIKKSAVHINPSPLTIMIWFQFITHKSRVTFVKPNKDGEQTHIPFEFKIKKNPTDLESDCIKL